jgi:TP901 family phage tail tape measure protein
MAKNIPVNLVITGVDRVGKVLDRIKKRFPALARATRRASTAFKIFQAKTERLRRSLAKVGRGMRNVGKQMTTKLTLPIGLAGAGIIRAAVNFQKSMNRVGALTRTIVEGKVAPAFDKLTEKAKMLGRTTAFSASEVADAMGFLAQAGFKTNEILAAIGPTLDLAAASNTGLAETADIASNIMGAFGIKAKEMTRVADVLSLTTATSNVNMEQLAETMKFAGPIASKFGASLEETAALAGLLGNVGIQGSQAGTALKNMFLKLTNPSKKARGFLNKFGISIADQNGKIKSAIKIFQELAPVIGKLPQAAQLPLLNELFGLRGIAGGAELITQAMKKGKRPIEAFTKTLGKSTGVAKDMANTLLRGAPGAIKRMTSALEGLALAIADSGLIEWFTQVVMKLTKTFSSLSTTSKKFLKFATIIAIVVAVLGPFLIVIGSIVSAIGPLISAIGFLKAGFIFIIPLLKGALIPLLGVLKFAILAVGKALLFLVANPVGAVIAAVGLLIIGSILLIKNWGKVKEFFINLWADIAGIFKSGVKKVAGFLARVPGVGFLMRKLGISGETKAPQVQLGPAVGAREQQQRIADQRNETTNNARVQVDFNNMPKGTRVQSEAQGPLELNMGFAGAIQ